MHKNHFKNADPFTLAPESHSETLSRAKESAFWSSIPHDFDETVCGPSFKKSCCWGVDCAEVHIFSLPFTFFPVQRSQSSHYSLRGKAQRRASQDQGRVDSMIPLPLPLPVNHLSILFVFSCLDFVLFINFYCFCCCFVMFLFFCQTESLHQYSFLSVYSG